MFVFVLIIQPKISVTGNFPFETKYISGWQNHNLKQNAGIPDPEEYQMMLKEFDVNHIFSEHSCIT